MVAWRKLVFSIFTLSFYLILTMPLGAQAAHAQDVLDRVAHAAASMGRGDCITCGNSLDQRVISIFDTRFGIDGEYEIWRCSKCGLEQILPVPAPSQLKSLYETYYNFGGETGTIYTRLRQIFFGSPLYRLWIWLDGDISFHARTGGGKLIDVGCNEGRGLEIYARNGFEVEGQDLSETAATAARRRGFVVHARTLDGFDPPAPYDVAVLSNVLEHAPAPRQMLVDVRRILSERGQLWISCPNSQSWLRRLFGAHWINWHAPFHISHFSPQTLTTLLTSAGFADVEIRQATPAVWVSMSIIARIFAKQGRKTRQLRNPLLVMTLMFLVRCLAFPLLWVQNRKGRGDCLLVTATKV
jgi:SAM-dependent methyltransferase